MPTDLFGFASGIRQADLDNAALRQSALDARAAELDINKAEKKLEQNEAFLHAISSGKVGQSGDDAKDLYDLGRLAFATENIIEGKELFDSASTIANQQSLMNRREAETNFEHNQAFSNMLGGVKDQASWEQVNQHYKMMFGEDSPYAQFRYTPQLVEDVKASALNEQQKAAAAVSEARIGVLKAQEQTEKMRRLAVEEQWKSHKTRRENLAKTGGKPVPDSYITAVTRQLKDKFEDAGDRNLGAMALSLAERVFPMVQDEGLSMSTAINTVIKKAYAEGELGGLTPISSFSPGTHRDKPLLMPTTKAGKIDPTKMKINHYYAVPGTGEVVLYTEDGKFLVIAPEENVDDSFSAEEDEFSEDDAEDWEEE